MDKISPPSEDARFLRSIVFLNCGGTLDLTQNAIYEERKDVKMYVIDSHRPFHHKNVNDNSNRIFIVADSCASLDHCPTAQDDEDLDALAAVQSDSEEDEDYDSELEAEEKEAKEELADLQDEDFDDDNEELVARKKRRVLDDEVDLEEEACEKKEAGDEIDDLNQEIEAEGSGSQPRIGEKRPPQTELKDQRRLKR